jgi:hypothetical protein
MDLSSSRDEQGRPPVRTTDTTAANGSVKPVPGSGRAELSPARDENPSSAETGSVWEQVFARSNLFAALDRVEKNAGAPGSDGLRVDELRSYLKDHWLETRASLDAETYRPQPVRRVEIPKPDGGVRLLGIPMPGSYCTSIQGAWEFLDGSIRVRGDRHLLRKANRLRYPNRSYSCSRRMAHAFSTVVGRACVIRQYAPGSG